MRFAEAQETQSKSLNRLSLAYGQTAYPIETADDVPGSMACGICHYVNRHSKVAGVENGLLVQRLMVMKRFNPAILYAMNLCGQVNYRGGVQVLLWHLISAGDQLVSWSGLVTALWQIKRTLYGRVGIGMFCGAKCDPRYVSADPAIVARLVSQAGMAQIASMVFTTSQDGRCCDSA